MVLVLHMQARSGLIRVQCTARSRETRSALRLRLLHDSDAVGWKATYVCLNWAFHNLMCAPGAQGSVMAT